MEQSDAASGDAKVPDEQRLLAKLLNNYERSVRPVFNASHSVLIQFGLTLIHILDMVSGDACRFSLH